MSQPYDVLIKMLTESRHDIVNHLQVIHAYARISGNEKIIEYIDNLSADYRMHSRLSNMNHKRIAANLMAMMMKYPELQFDYYKNCKKLLLTEISGMTEVELTNLFINVIIALAAQATDENKIHIVISVESSTGAKKNRINFSLYGKALREQLKPIECLKSKLKKYSVEYHQVYQDAEVFEWELVFNS